MLDWYGQVELDAINSSWARRATSMGWINKTGGTRPNSARLIGISK
jgi:hypothetical protein